MVQPKDAPVAFRPTGALRERFEAYVARSGLNRNQACLVLLEAGLDAEEGGPAKKSSKVAPAPVAKPVAPKAAGAPKSANQQAQELAERRAAEARRTAGWFTPKGRK